MCRGSRRKADQLIREELVRAGPPLLAPGAEVRGRVYVDTGPVLAQRRPYRSSTVIFTSDMAISTELDCAQLKLEKRTRASSVNPFRRQPAFRAAANRSRLMQGGGGLRAPDPSGPGRGCPSGGAPT